MYESHYVFETPPDDTTIRQYMPFHRFVWLIANKALYFRRLDQHEDQMEGWTPPPIDPKDRRFIRYNSYINCWHMNINESEAMWKLYGKDSAVSIETTVGRLKQSIEKSLLTTPDIPNLNIEVNIGTVKYKWDSTINPDKNYYIPVLYKRSAFRHEEELRLHISPSSDNPPDTTNVRKQFEAFGSNITDDDILKMIGDKARIVRIDINHLIQHIIINPKSDDSFRNSVQFIKNNHIPSARIKPSNYY